MARRLRIVPRRYWAVVRGPHEMPCLFGSYDDADENRDPDEYLVQVEVKSAAGRNGDLWQPPPKDK